MPFPCTDHCSYHIYLLFEEDWNITVSWHLFCNGNWPHFFKKKKKSNSEVTVLFLTDRRSGILRNGLCCFYMTNGDISELSVKDTIQQKYQPNFSNRKLRLSWKRKQHVGVPASVWKRILYARTPSLKYFPLS